MVESSTADFEKEKLPIPESNGSGSSSSTENTIIPNDLLHVPSIDAKPGMLDSTKNSDIEILEEGELIEDSDIE